MDCTDRRQDQRMGSQDNVTSIPLQKAKQRHESTIMQGHAKMARIFLDTDGFTFSV